MAKHGSLSRMITGLLMATAVLLAIGGREALAQRETTPAAPAVRVEASEIGQGGFRLGAQAPAGMSAATFHVEGSYRKAGGTDWIYPGTLAANVAGEPAGIEIPASLLASIAPADAQWRFRVRVADPPGLWSEWAEAGARTARMGPPPAEPRNPRLLRSPVAEQAASRRVQAVNPPAATIPVATPGALAPQFEAKPDYAIGLDWQFEYKNTAMAWRFRVENKGGATPASQPVGWKNSQSSATLVISRGHPCPNPTSWAKLASYAVPPLAPGTSMIVPADPYRMPEDKVGQGCRFRAGISGPEGDADTSNNVMHLLTKVTPLPDLTVAWGDYKGGPSNPLEVVNYGQVPAGPSQFHFECKAAGTTASCGKPYQQPLAHRVVDVPVPALKPLERFTVMVPPAGLMGAPTPGLSWTATADHQKEVSESNETNNVMKGGE